VYSVKQVLCRYVPENRCVCVCEREKKGSHLNAGLSCIRVNMVIPSCSCVIHMLNTNGAVMIKFIYKLHNNKYVVLCWNLLEVLKRGQVKQAFISFAPFLIAF
jgi:hypothetical protein